MNSDWMTQLHDWQKDGFVKVLTKCNRADLHNAIPVNASVGSGKTFFGSLAFADFIDLHKNEKTIQVFVTPRIKLCAQQSKELTDKIAGCGPFSYQKFEEFPGNGSPFQIIPVDCTRHEWNRHNDYLDVQHAIFIICDASLWGEDRSKPGARWKSWMKRFAIWQKAGYIFGNIIFDEAHNFKTDDYVKKMFGTTIFNKHTSIDYVNNKCLLTYFQNVILLSGTPANYQKDITKAFIKNACECPLNVAIKNGWVEYPILNLVHICAADLFSTAIIKILKHEVNIIKPANGVRFLVNFGSIPEIDEFEHDEYIQTHMNKDFHLITIHSGKKFDTEDKYVRECKSMVDGITYNHSDVYDLIEGLDTGITENEKMQPVLNSILDGKPIMVGQVAMIGEGINIRSFNSVITKSNSDTTAMQQIGRVLRKYNGKKFPNVYCVYENCDSLFKLLSELMIEHSLTSDCFDWGKRIDITGNGYINDNDENDEVKEKTKIGWIDIDPNFDPEISEIQYSDQFRNVRLSKDFKDFTESDEYEELLKNFNSRFSEEELKLFTTSLKRTNNIMGNSKKAGIKNNRGRKAKVNTKQNKQNNEKENNNNEMNNDILLFEVIKTIRGYVLRHMDNEHIMTIIKEHPEALVKNQFSHIPILADKIIETRFCKNLQFLKIVGLY